MSFFSSFFGDEGLKDIDSRIDALVNQFPMLNRTQPVDTISGDFVNSFMENSPKEEVDRLLQSVTVARDRIERYNIYDEAYRYVPVIKRMIKVYIANILQKNPITGKCLLVRESNEIASEKKSEVEVIEKAKDFANTCIKTFDLILKLRSKIMPMDLVYGDCFFEVVDINAEAKKQDSATNLSVITLFESELKNIGNELEQLSHRKNNGYNNQADNLIQKLSKYLVEIAETPILREEKQEKNKENKISSFDDVLVKIHRPHNIIILQTDYGSTLGFLEVAKDDTPQVYNLTQSLSTLVGRVTSILGRDVASQENVTDRLVRYVVKQALEKAGKHVTNQGESIDDLLKGLDPQVYSFIKRLIVEQGLSQKAMQLNRIKVRFIPTSRMISFSMLSSEYDPYGGSFIDPLTFHCKLYIISQLANIILKLSRAAPVRLIWRTLNLVNSVNIQKKWTTSSQALTRAANFSY